MSFLAARLKKDMTINKLISADKDRCRVILSVAEGLITTGEAAKELNLSKRHLRRLLEKYKQTRNLTSVIPKRRTGKPWNRSDNKIEKEVIRLKKEIPLRSNIRISEIVQEKFNCPISHSSIRRILLRHDCYERKPIRRRMYKKVRVDSFGEMFQMDTCEGAWLKGYRRVYLICVMDAYSRYIVGWKWADSDSAWNNICILRQIIEKYGKFRLLYTDNASFFKTIRHDKSIYQKHKPDDEYETTIQRMMRELGILMVAHKPGRPEGKGRLERFFRTMQERFIREHTAKTLDELNRHFKKWISWYNNYHVVRTIGCRPKNRLKPSVVEPANLSREDLDKIFSYQYTRKVDKFNSFSFEGRQYVIDRKNCKAGGGHLVARTVNLYVMPETITVYYHDCLIQKFERIPGEQTNIDQFITKK
jgi:putative transposase